MYQNTFIHGKDKNEVSSYFITRIGETVLIKFSAVFFKSINKKKLCIFPINVKTIPSFNKALLRVFKIGSTKAYYENVIENGDRIIIGVDSERYYTLKITITNKKDLFNMENFDIFFENGELDYEKRVPTSEMTWLIDSLQNLYNGWTDKVIFLESDHQSK